MLDYNPLMCWPSSEELPDSDETPVDNELQDLIPTLLRAVLAMIWAERMDWFFGIDMGVYYHPDQPAIVPDGFLSLGVERVFDERLRLSYAIWEEQQVPILALEVVSQTYRGEYSTKKAQYAHIGVLYYAVYNPNRRRKAALEVYRLEQGSYVLQSGNPVWLPEIGLGLGRERGTYQGVEREWLYWYNEQGQRQLTPEEISQNERQLRVEAEQLRLKAEQLRLEAQQRAERLAELVRQLGGNPDNLT